MTWRDLLTQAAQEIGATGQGETLSAPDAVALLNLANELLDSWNADRLAVYANVFTVYTLVPALQPHTIGPTGATYTVAQRPVSIDGANIVINTDPNNTVRTPLNLRDDDWWLGQAVRQVTSQLPTDLYYSADWPNGSIYLWPVPTTAYGLELETRTLLSSIDFDTVFSLPPGYRSALRLSIAEMACELFGRAIPAMLPRRAAMARGRMFSNNSETPRLTTKDAGMPSGGGNRAAFNYRTGMTT